VVYKGSSRICGRQRALKGGVWRALWRFALFPFRDIETLTKSMREALASPKVKKTTPGGATFSKISRGTSPYKQLFLDLVGDSDEIATQRIIKLAQEEHLDATPRGTFRVRLLHRRHAHRSP
jgi:hypothetical protein